MSRLCIKKLIPWNVYIDGIKKLIKRTLGYGSGYPWNCGYYDGSTLWGDCWCTHPKSMVWSIFSGVPMWDNYTTGANYYLDQMVIGLNPISTKDSSGLPDWGGYYLLDGYCDDISFSEMISGDIKPSLIGTPDHMGCYFGEITINGLTYNTHEMTPNGMISPRMLSYVDEDGYCYSCKGGAYIRKWNRACRMTGIIDYTGHDPQPEPPKHPWSIDNVAVYIMRGSLPDGTKIPNGMDNRKAFFAEYGYTADEVQEAQDIVNSVYEKHDLDVLACDLAMRFISGEAGDGVTMRRQWIAKNYPDYDTETLFRKTQDKVNEYLS